MDASAHYRHLIALGRDEFLAAAAPAALVRYRSSPAALAIGGDTVTIDEGSRGFGDETLPRSRLSLSDLDVDLELYPLVKKPGASFADRITIGRTSNNDIVIPEHSVSRLHLYIRQDGERWLVADAGSKNGSWLRGEPLEPRRERPLPSRAVLRLGDVELTFYLAGDLYDVLGGGT